MKRCIFCRKEKAVLHDGVCTKCLGKGANISLMSAIQDQDKNLIKKIEDRSKQGEIIRLI